MIETERLLLKYYSGGDKEIRDMLKNCYCISASEWREMRGGMQVEYKWTDGKNEDFHRFLLHRASEWTILRKPGIHESIKPGR